MPEFMIKPQALPGCCFFCRSDNREGFVDTEVSNQWDDAVPNDLLGAVYICTECIRIYARAAGLEFKDEDKSAERIDELETENYELKKKLEDYGDVKRIIDEYNQSANLVISGHMDPSQTPILAAKAD